LIYEGHYYVSYTNNRKRLSVKVWLGSKCATYYLQHTKLILDSWTKCLQMLPTV